MSDQLLFVILSGLVGVYIGVNIGWIVANYEVRRKRRRY